MRAALLSLPLVGAAAIAIGTFLFRLRRQPAVGPSIGPAVGRSLPLVGTRPLPERLRERGF